MESRIIEELVQKQQAYFNTNVTKDVQFRIRNLQKLQNILKENESQLYDAIYADFKKSSFETYATELAHVHHEINLAIQNIKQWSAIQPVETNIASLPGKSYLIPEPLGSCLVIGAWNYPYLECLQPAVSALAAGNTCIIKPSELAENSSKAMARVINENFDAEYLFVVEGGIPETTSLLQQPLDKIFFTGSPTVGKIIMRAAAEHLTPVTLELGGKSPAFVCEDAKLDVITKRIVWSKFLNAGQTCVAPDYVLIDAKVKAEFVRLLQKNITEIYGPNPRESEAYTQIINSLHLERLRKLIDPEKVIIGGEIYPDERFIFPTVLDNVTFEDAVMSEEIFGPLLPLIEFTDIHYAIQQVKSQPKPLALYVFSQNKSLSQQILHELSFGGGVVNDAVVHLANSNLPFGGVGNSGMGAYHGKFGFDTFTHYKPVMEKSTLLEPSVKYPPYSGWKRKLIHWLLE